MSEERSSFWRNNYFTKKINAAKKKPSVAIMGLGVVPPFYATMVGMYGSFMSSIIGFSLNIRLIITIVLFVVVYILATKIMLRNRLQKGELEFIGNTATGIPIFKVGDSIANAIAIGFCKHFQYIIVSTGLLNLFNDKQAEYEAIIEHESNHIRLMHNLTTIITQLLFLAVYTSIMSMAINSAPIITSLTAIVIILFVFLFPVF
jgi:Zn-dependent protease with chaperone function